MDKREQIVIETAKHVARIARRHPDLNWHDPVELKAAVIALSYAVGLLERGETIITATDKGREEMPKLIEALQAGATLDEAFHEATGRPLDLGVRRLRELDHGDECRCESCRYHD